MARQTAGRDVPPDARIGIIGAGPSGLTAAHYLGEAGYKNLILCEKKQQVGGKCESVTVDGRVYELGAVLGAPNYAIIHELAARVGLQEGMKTACSFYTPLGQRTTLTQRRRVPSILWQLFVRFAWLTARKYHDIYQPGLAGIHPDLFENFQTFTSRHGLHELPPLFQPIATGFGYGYAEQVPAAYMLKYLDWPILLACARGKGLFFWPEGIQTLWRRVAREYEVLLGVDIKQIMRGEQVIIHTTADSIPVEYLILACPLDHALSFLDATPMERDLFSRIRTYDYWVLLAEVEGLPHDTGFVCEHFSSERQGHLMLWYCRWPETNLYTLYLLSDGQSSQDLITANCTADLRRMGARLRQLLHVRRWHYFPHVSPADMANGYYDQLEAMQGQRRTFYCGELMSFSTLEKSASYSRALVERFFQPGRRMIEIEGRTAVVS